MQHEIARAGEKRLAAAVAGSVLTANSGAGSDKGDVRIRRFYRGDNKTTKHKSFTVTIAMVEKLLMDAASNDEMPAMPIEFVDPDTGRVLQKVALVPYHVLQWIEELARER